MIIKLALVQRPATDDRQANRETGLTAVRDAAQLALRPNALEPSLRLAIVS